MKMLLPISCVAFLAMAQTPVPPGQIDITADQQEKIGPIFHLSGHVAIKPAGLLLEADSADLNQDAHRIVARGNVLVSVSASDFDFTSDRCERAGALVHLSGHVSVKVAEALLEADTADLNENTQKIVFNGDLHVRLN